jgi:hypothetical protein
MRTFSNGESITLTFHPSPMPRAVVALQVLARCAFTTAESRRLLAQMFERVELYVSKHDVWEE